MLSTSSITQQTFSHPWHDTHTKLTEQYGQALEQISEVDKWSVISSLTRWYAFSLEIQSYGGTPVSLVEYLLNNGCVWDSGVVNDVLNVLASVPLDRYTTLNFIHCLTQQLLGGYFAPELSVANTSF